MALLFKALTKSFEKNFHFFKDQSRDSTRRKAALAEHDQRETFRCPEGTGRLQFLFPIKSSSNYAEEVMKKKRLAEMALGASSWSDRWCWWW